jgi:uncharacterized protein
MKIGIIGASGNIGSRIHAEATARRHDVASFTRSGAGAKGASWRDLDVFDLDALGAVIASVPRLCFIVSDADGQALA